MYVNLTFKDPDWPLSTIESMAAFAQEHRAELRSCQRDARFPADIYAAMGSRGWVGPFTPIEEGSSGLGVAECCLIEEEVGRLGLVSPRISIQGQRWLIDWATPEQRERYLPGMARGHADLVADGERRRQSGDLCGRLSGLEDLLGFVHDAEMSAGMSADNSKSRSSE